MAILIKCVIMISGKIIVDTSSWIELFRNENNNRTALINTYLQLGTKICVCPPILQEVLQGVRNEKEWKNTYEMFLFQEYLDLSIYKMSVNAAQMYFQLRKQGITIRKPNDCLIAAYALASDITLVHNDKDFEEIAKIYPLKFYNPL